MAPEQGRRHLELMLVGEGSRLRRVVAGDAHQPQTNAQLLDARQLHLAALVCVPSRQAST
jgi:hypothetical protein